jgi:hypothetical protein
VNEPAEKIWEGRGDAMSDARLSIVPGEAVDDRALGEMHLRLLLHVGRQNNKRGWLRLSQSEIAAAWGCSRSRLCTAVKELVEAGYLEKRDQVSTGESFCVYRISADPAAARAAAAACGGGVFRPGNTPPSGAGGGSVPPGEHPCSHSGNTPVPAAGTPPIYIDNRLSPTIADKESPPPPPTSAAPPRGGQDHTEQGEASEPQGRSFGVARAVPPTADDEDEPGSPADGRPWPPALAAAIEAGASGPALDRLLAPLLQTRRVSLGAGALAEKGAAVAALVRRASRLPTPELDAVAAQLAGASKRLTAHEIASAIDAAYARVGKRAKDRAALAELDLPALAAAAASSWSAIAGHVRAERAAAGSDAAPWLEGLRAAEVSPTRLVLVAANAFHATWTQREIGASLERHAGRVLGAGRVVRVDIVPPEEWRRRVGNRRSADEGGE